MPLGQAAGIDHRPINVDGLPVKHRSYDPSEHRQAGSGQRMTNGSRDVPETLHYPLPSLIRTSQIAIRRPINDHGFVDDGP
jgi:hypothetical protein